MSAYVVDDATIGEVAGLWQPTSQTPSTISGGPDDECE